jgi:hypothetical protein
MLPARIFRNRWESIPPRSKIEADGKQASPHLHHQIAICRADERRCYLEMTDLFRRQSTRLSEAWLSFDCDSA